MSHLSHDSEPQGAAAAPLQRQDARPGQPAEIQLRETAVAITHAELHDARIFGRNSIHVKVIQAGQSRPFGDTTWEAQLDFSTAGGGAWSLPLAEIELAALLLATASLQPPPSFIPSIPVSGVLLRRDAAASWRVIVRKPYDGWD